MLLKIKNNRSKFTQQKLLTSRKIHKQPVLINDVTLPDEMYHGIKSTKFTDQIEQCLERHYHHTRYYTTSMKITTSFFQTIFIQNHYKSNTSCVGKRIPS